MHQQEEYAGNQGFVAGIQEGLSPSVSEKL